MRARRAADRKRRIESQRAGSAASVRSGRLQPAHLERPLFGKAEPLARAGDDLDVGGLGEEAGKERRVVEPPLETVEDEQEPDLAEGGDDPGGRVVPVAPFELEGPREGDAEAGSPSRLGRGDEDDPVRKDLRTGGQAGGRLDREARLPDASGPEERQQPAVGVRQVPVDQRPARRPR